MKLAAKQKYKYADGMDRPDDKIIPFLDNPFVSGFKEDRLFYTKDFDVAMYKKIYDEGINSFFTVGDLGFSSHLTYSSRLKSSVRTSLFRLINKTLGFLLYFSISASE